MPAAMRSGALLLLSIATSAAAQETKPDAPTLTGKHLLTAEALLKEVAPENTSYRHKNNIVKRNSPDSPGVCHADCSGLVNWLLLDATGRPATELQTWFHSKRPVARHYFEAIVAEKYFSRVLHLK